MENEELPQYMRIAGSVAGRIAEGQFAEGEKLSGRSKLSSEYQVSPETIRKAVQLLRDMQVVTVKEQSGVYVRSAENAKRYLQMIGEKLELRRKKQKLRALLAQQEAVARQVSELCGSILDDPMQPIQAAEQLQNYACRVPQDWSDAGRSLARSISGRQRARPSSQSGAQRPCSSHPARTRSCMGAIWSFLWATRRPGRLSPGFSGKRKQHESGRCLPAGRERRHLWFITKFTRSIWPSLRPI